MTPRILAFDTSSTRESVALLEGETLRAELRSDLPETHSALLLKSVEFLLERVGWTLRDVTLIAVGIGPGSFTGVRIGVATAMGLAQSLGIPLAGVSGLDALARQVALLDTDERIGVMIDAHRNQVYFAEYEISCGKARPTGKPELVDIAALESRLADISCLTGDLKREQWEWLEKSFKRKTRRIPADPFLAEGIGRLAMARKKTWRSGDFPTLEPLYIRPPDALKNKKN